MKNRTQQLQVSKETYKKVMERDEGCIFCRQGYNMHPKFPTTMDCVIMDAMHFINKSKGGLGIKQNLAIGCRFHHGHLDNGNKGQRQEMLEIFEEYLKSKYEDWNKENLVYRK